MDNHIVIDEDGDENLITIQVPYNEEFNNELKQAIPYDRRHPSQGLGWQPEDKVWRFNLDDKDIVSALVAKHFPKPKYSVEWK